jgi:hypothetical protein
LQVIVEVGKQFRLGVACRDSEDEQDKIGRTCTAKSYVESRAMKKGLCFWGDVCVI